MFIKNILILMILSFSVFSQDFQFNADSAYQSIEHLSVTIGPRPMGSEKESDALEWAKNKFNSFGADTAYILPFIVAEGHGDKLITNSGTAVGIFKGETDSAIVIGGHIDSAGPEFPGANDNASGASTVIELSRIWSQRPHHYTMIFCTFGGEELGLMGSKNFVNDFSGINNVALMVSADMGGTDSDIILMCETDSMQAPKWLVKDAYEVNDAINYNRLTYETQFSTENNLSSNGAGSDHMSFLNKGIPALDFTSDVKDSPIHTQQDNMNFIDKAALGEYGNYIDHLLLKYQKGGIQPSQAGPEKFMLWQLSGIELYLPMWFIKIFNWLALILGIVAFIIARNNRIIFQESERIKISGIKIFVIFLIMLIFSQLGDAVIQIFKGYRYPWVSSIGSYYIYDIIWAVAGLWVGLQLTRKWKFSPDPYIYSKRALIVLFIFTAVSLLLRARLAFYPAFMLVFVSLGILINKSWLRTLFVLISPLLMILFVFNEEFSWISRSLINIGFRLDNPIQSMMANAIFIAFLSILFLPVLNAYAYLAAANKSIKNGLRIFRKPLFAGGLFIIIVGFGIYLGMLPAYNAMWRPSVHVDASYDLPEGKSELTIVGNEYFKDVKVSGDTLMEFDNTRIHRAEIPITFEADWIHLSGNVHRNTILSDSMHMDSVEFNWIIKTEKPYLELTFSIRTDTSEIKDPFSILPFSHEKNLIRYNFFECAGDTMNISGSFKCDSKADIIRTLEARYVGLPVNLNVESQLASIRYRTTVQYSDTLNKVNDEIAMFKNLQINKE